MLDMPCDCNKTENLIVTYDAFLSYSSTDTLSIPESTSVGTSFRITSLIIDSSHGRKSKIRFNFSSNLVTDAFIGTVNFQIFKQCPEQIVPIPVGSVWSYTNIFISSEAIAFSFKACDEIYDECCAYYVAVTIASAVTEGTISINNANLSTLVSVDYCSADKQLFCSNDINPFVCKCRCGKLCGRIFSKCSSLSNVSIADETPAGTTVTLVSLSINTEKFNHPCIELEFSTNTVFPESLLTAFIQIYKQCDCQMAQIPIGPVWLLEHALPESNYNTFTFHIHDCLDKKEGCCTYYAILTVQSAIGEAATLFRNSTLRATIIDCPC